MADKKATTPEQVATTTTASPAASPEDGPVIDITKFRQELGQKAAEFLGSNSSASNQPKTFKDWFDQFVEFVDG